MIQKFRIFLDKENDLLIIEESAVLDKVKRNIDYQDLNSEDFSIVCEEKYESRTLKNAILKDNLIASIRTKNMYPIWDYAAVIADSIAKLYESTNSQTVELIFDDQRQFQ